MLYNIIEDISTITTLPLKTLYKLTNKTEDCICNNVLESKIAGDSISTLDIGIGKIIITVTTKDINYTFIPSKELESKLISTIKNNKSPLIHNIENTLVNKILNTYKDLI